MVWSSAGIKNCSSLFNDEWRERKMVIVEKKMMGIAKTRKEQQE